MDLGLKGKRALVTASSKGIGRAVAEGLVAEGCEVGICSRSKDDLIETTREIKNKHHFDVFWSVCDLNKQKDLENTFQHFVREFGQIDILINNCGGPPAGYLADLDDEKWQESCLIAHILIFPFFFLVERIFSFCFAIFPFFHLFSP